MRTIYKYPLPETPLGVITIQMPQGARVLCVQVQDGTPCIWSLVRPSMLLEDRHFRIYATDELIEGLGEYIGTFQQLVPFSSYMAFHLYEVIS